MKMTSVHFMYVFKNADIVVEKCLKMSQKLQGGDRKNIKIYIFAGEVMTSIDHVMVRTGVLVPNKCTRA